MLFDNFVKNMGIKSFPEPASTFQDQVLANKGSNSQENPRK